MAIKGNDLRKSLGGTRLRSTRIDRVRKSSKGVEFRGQRHGHGVGLCQWGARLQADRAASTRRSSSSIFRLDAVGDRRTKLASTSTSVSRGADRHPAASCDDASRLMVVERATGAWRHHHFSDLPQFLEAGDCLVLNTTRVAACRLIGKKITGGKAEILLVKELEPGLWAALGSGLKNGATVLFPGELEGRLEGLNDDGEYLVRFARKDMNSYMDSYGAAPVPPYIAKKRPPRANDLERYQTVYADEKAHRGADGGIAFHARAA